MGFYRAILLALGVLALPGMAQGQCAAKFSPRLCAFFAAGLDSSFLTVRIILDAKVESGFVWEKKTPPELTQPRPLRAFSESLITKYDLRQPNHPESAYVRLYGAQDPNPSISQVMYHSAGVTKANLARLITEAYVASAESFCDWRIISSLCTEINNHSDSDTLRIGIRLQDKVQSDPVARKALLTKYAVRESTWANDMCVGDDFYATAAAIVAMGRDPEILEIGLPNATCILPIQRPRSPFSKRIPLYQPDQTGYYRLDGRVFPYRGIDSPILPEPSIKSP